MCRNILFIWISTPIFSFIGYTLTEVFRKPDNWRQNYKQTSSSFNTSNDAPRSKNYLYVITGLRNSCLITFLKKQYRSRHRKSRSSHPKSSVKKYVKNLANSTGKQLCGSIFLIKLQAFSLYVFFLKKTPTQMLSCKV